MRRLFRWLLATLAAVLALVVLAVAFKDPLLTAFARRRLAAETGMRVELQRLHLGLGAAAFAVEGLKLYNPPEFGGGLFLDLPELRVELDPESLANRRLRFTLVRLNLAELNIVENAQGVRNIDRFQQRRKPRGDGEGGPRPRRPMDFGGIDKLHLTLGRLKFTSLKNPSAGWQLPMGIQDLELKDVRSTTDLSAVLFAMALRNGAALLGGDIFMPHKWLQRMLAPAQSASPTPP